MENVHVNTGDKGYEIVINRGILEQAGAMTAELLPSAEKIAVITDETVDCLYGGRLERSLGEAGLTVRRIAIAPGESSKNLQVLGEVYDQLAAFGLSRDDGIITLGGGVPGDLGGLAAATWLRGVPFIQIPTTLLAQVDSSVGGKTAVDLPGGKNLVGCFYQPKGVLIDPELLATLPRRVMADGLGEVVKYGCIADEELFRLLEQLPEVEALLQPEEVPIEEIISRCCRIKARLVEADELDQGVRMLLNFGHTIGHAIERYYEYRTYTHGEAVSMGMAMITKQTEKMELTAQGTSERLEQLLHKLDLPADTDAVKTDLLLHMGQDKKKRGRRITLVILEKIGQASLQTVLLTENGAERTLIDFLPES